MKIRIDCGNEQILIMNEKIYTHIEVQQMYLNTLTITNDKKDLPSLICELYSFEKLAFDDDENVDYCIDMDINLVYQPIY